MSKDKSVKLTWKATRVCKIQITCNGEKFGEGDRKVCRKTCQRCNSSKTTVPIKFFDSLRGKKALRCQTKFWAINSTKTEKIITLREACKYYFSPHVRELGFRNPGNFFLVKSGIWAYSSMNPEAHKRLESGIQVPLTKILDSIPRTVLDYVRWDDILELHRCCTILSRILSSVGVQTQSKAPVSGGSCQWSVLWTKHRVMSVWIKAFHLALCIYIPSERFQAADKLWLCFAAFGQFLHVVHANDTVILHCSPPNCYPPPNITWYKDDKQLVFCCGRSSRASSNKLVIKGVNTNDSGNYHCVAKCMAAPPQLQKITLAVRGG